LGDGEVKDYVKKRYSKIAENSESCCQSSGCACSSTSKEVALKLGYSKDELQYVPDSANMGLGCGNPTALASLKKGETVVDLGSGGGIDAFLASKRVGVSGKVIGIDMTQEMINKAKSNALKYGYQNVEFKLAEIEDLPLENDSVDVIISNCVINLSPDKNKVFSEAYRILKPGGRFLISDIVTKGKLPESLKKDFSAWASCISGALEKNNYLEIIKKAGFTSINIVSESVYNFDVSEELKGKILSVQIEAFK
jgi:ubiquinone/menaquinone biosynthesis C-methylase UbiE